MYCISGLLLYFDFCWNLALETEAANDADVIP